MKKRVLSLTMAFLLAFTMLPTQAAAEELPEYEEIVEENASEEESLEEDALETESLEAEAHAAEVENTEGTVLTEETEAKEEVPAEQEVVSEAPAQEETKPAEAEKTTEAAAAQEIASPAEEIRPAEQQVSVRAMGANGIALQAEEDETEAPVTQCVTHTFENGICTACKYKCIHENATDTECHDCKMTMIIKGEKDGAVTRYASLGDAFDNAPSGSTLTLLKDVNDGNTTYTLKDGKTLTLDTETYAINVSKIQVNGGALTLQGSGKISAVWIVNSGKLSLPARWTGTVEDVTLQTGTPGLNMESGIVKRLDLFTNVSNNNVQISGGTFNSIKNPLNNPILLNKLLKAGYVFKQGNQAIEFSRELSANESLGNVRVEKCEEHRDKDGNNLCDFCNQSATFPVEVTAVDDSTAKYSGLQGTFNEAQNGATVKLLENISARTENVAYIVDKKQLTLDLNGQTISGNGVSATNGADLTVTGDGTVEGELTFDSKSTGKLSGGKFGKVVSNNSGKSLEDLLETGYAYWNYGDNKWQQNITENSIDKVEVLQAPIRKLEIINSIGKLTYGYSANEQQYIQANATLQGTYEEHMVEYQWYKVDGTESSVPASTKQQFSIPEGLTAGMHTYRVYATCGGYTVKADVTFEVLKADAKVTKVPGAEELTYTGQDQQLVTAGTTSDGTIVYSLEKEGTYTADIPTGKVAGEYTVWYKVQGDSNHNDSEPASVTATISYLATDAAATLAETNKGQNGWYTSTVTIQAPAGYTISSTLEGTYAADFTTDTNGENTYYLRQDSSGFITDAKTIQVPIDTDQPSGGKTDLSDAALRVGWYLSKENITVTQSVEDATSGPDHIEYQLTPSTDSAGTLGSNQDSGSVSVNAEGKASFTISKQFKGSIEITPYDKAGNAGNPITFEKVAAEDEKPELKVTDTFAEGWYTTAQTVHVHAQDMRSGLYMMTYKMDDGDLETLFRGLSNMTVEKEVSFPAQEGVHTYSIIALDNAWNGVTVKVTIRQDTQAPTKPTLSISKEATDTTVTLQASATDETSGVQEYTLLETSGKIPPQTSEDGVFDLTYLNSDTEYVFTVTAKDNAGHISEISDVFNVKTRKKPFANAVVTLKNADKIYNGMVQTPDVEISMNGTALAADQYVVSYEQDGTAVAAPTKAGTYKVVVTAGKNSAYEGIASGQPTYTIAKKTITASLNGTLTKTYDGTTKVLEAQKLTVLLKGVEDDDKVTATADAYAYNSAEVKDADTITGSGIALAGADAENYQLAETKASVSAKILQKNLEKADVTLGAALVANGKNRTQAIEKVMLDGATLTAKDYEVTGNQAAAAGSYTLTIEGKNNYTGKVQKTYVVVPAEEQMVSTGNGDVKIGEGNLKVSVSAGQDAPEMSLASDKKTLIKMLIQGGNLTADEIVLIAEGATIELTLNVEHAEATVSAETRAAMEKTAGEFTIGRYLNITFTKSVNGEKENEIHEIKAPIKISFRLSNDLFNTDRKVKREYMVLRNHDGEVTSLPGTFADGIITFETDRFSDYAIAWKDTAVSTSGSKKKHRSGSAQQEATAIAAPEVSQLVQAQSAPTGDTAPIEWMLLLAALSAAGIGMILAKKRKEN